MFRGVKILKIKLEALIEIIRFLHKYINWGIVSIKAIKRELQLADLGTAHLGYPQLQHMGTVIHGEI